MTTSDPDYEKIAVRYSCSFMNNVKWRRVFTALADAGVREIRSEWKHIDSDYITQHIMMPSHTSILETRFQDGYFQPYEYKWIEWIRIPRRYFDENRKLTRDQDLAPVEAALSRCGRLNLVVDDDAITLIAYKK